MRVLESSIDRRRAGLVATAVLLAACGGKILAETSEVLPSQPVPTANAAPAYKPPVPDAATDAPVAEKPQLPPSAELVDLGNHRTGETIAFTVPPGTLGFQLVVQGD